MYAPLLSEKGADMPENGTSAPPAESKHSLESTNALYRQYPQRGSVLKVYWSFEEHGLLSCNCQLCTPSLSFVVARPLCILVR